MGTFKLQIPAQFMLTQILDGAALGSRRLLVWNARAPRLAMSHVIRADHRFETRARDSQIVSEFKLKLRQTEDLINKLGFSLREIYNDQN
jgi:hypothetical protein